MERIADLMIEVNARNRMSPRAATDLLDSEEIDLSLLECDVLVQDEIATPEEIQAQVWREELVEQYCDAVEMGDLNAISNVLEEASNDEILDRMIDEANDRMRSWESSLS